jgi:uncharacterized protein YdhG (YjbR/CyaY superfamily)
MSKPTTIEEYILSAAPEAQPLLEQLVNILRAVAPDAEESIKWSAPAFTLKRVLFMLAAHKNYVSFAPTPAVIRHFKERFGDIESTDSTVKFPIGKPLPADLVKDMAIFRLHDVIENDARWM